ncbi:MAG: ATP-binding cassette domain-containing protein [Chloroflexi bacterium]|nr:ATP-binding cassette domain-containing protein [Chloroflexota bacterium]
MIQVEDLTKRYGSFLAVDKINFHAEKGEIVGFLGPNGAGKTTTMRILTGFMPPSEGRATVAGFDVFNESLEVRKRVGYLPESVPLYTDMTVYEYLTFMGELRKVADREERIEETMDAVKITDRADTFISHLSKGYRQRVGLAQALLHHPEVLILDEPTIGLDPAQVVEVRNLIKDVGKDRTVMLSTHILTEAQNICNRVLIINKGQIVAEDSPARLQARLAGADRVRVKVSGDGTGIHGSLEGLPGVTRVNKVSDGEFEIETKPGQDVRPEVARRIVNGGWGLLELRYVGMSLEDIFLQLTRDEVEVAQ